MANKDLFKQAIAEAKSVREAAIANAKQSLEESLTPHLKDMLAAKLQELEGSEEVIAEETIVNDDLFKEEQERIKKLLEDDDADTFEKKKPIKKADPGKDDQPKLF